MPAPTSKVSDQPVRCAGCHRTIAWASNASALRTAIYCSQWCAKEAPSTPMEARNDMWRALVANGRTPVAVSRMYDVAHSLVYRTVAKG